MPFSLLAITDPGCAVSTRYRITNFRPHLQPNFVHVETIPWPRSTPEQQALLESVGAADAVVFQRFLPSPGWLKKIRRLAKRMAYDFDDAVIYTESTRGSPRLLLGRWWRFRAMMRSCDAVSAGNSYLAELAQREAAHTKVCVVPTTVESQRYDMEPRQAEAGTVLGWIGARSTLPYLDWLRRPLEQISAEIPDLKLHVIADQAPNLGRTRVELIPWSSTAEVRELKRLRAGLAPLPDDRWTRGKCGLRLLQYLAAGVPAVASPVGTQAAIIAAGAAVSARSPSEWRDGIRRVTQDGPLSAELTARGQQLVHQQFNTSTWAEQVRLLWCGNDGTSAAASEMSNPPEAEREAEIGRHFGIDPPAQ